MPALRRKSPSDAPVSIAGTTRRARIVLRSQSVEDRQQIVPGIGDAGLAMAFGGAKVTTTDESPATVAKVFRTSSEEDPGNIRQLTVARAS